MSRKKSSKNKSTKSGGSAFSVGMEKTASLDKTATGSYSVTQTQSFFYSPELNIMGS
jgi:hypothetical protein